MPKISIIIPVYNREKVLSRTLNSILNQTFKDWECLLVDDSSSDSSWSVLQEYASKDCRFKPLHNERKKGACGARNTGINYSQGTYLQFFDSDDRMHDTLLEDLYNSTLDKIDVVTCWTNVVNVENDDVIDRFEHITEGNIHKELLNGKTYVDTNCALIKRYVVEKIGGWSEDCPSYQEWDFHLRLSNIASYTTLKKHLIDYYVGGKDTISKSLPRAVRGNLYLLNKFRDDYYRYEPIRYLRNCFSTYCKINKVKESGDCDTAVELKKLYISIMPKYILIMIKILLPVRELKKHVVRCLNR